VKGVLGTPNPEDAEARPPDASGDARSKDAGVKAYEVRRTPRTQERAPLTRQQAPGFSLQNCSNLDAGEFAGGLVSFCGESGLAPPVCGAAAPPCGVPGFDGAVVVWVGAGAGVVAVAVDVLVVVVVVLVSERVWATVGVLFSPGTVSFGAAVGSGAGALSLLPPPPHPAKNGTSAVRVTAIATRR
jgi:hypothetical protein